jgi:virginiamycin B lyase
LTLALATAGLVILAAGPILFSRNALAAVGDITEFPIPTASAGNFPLAIAAGPDGNLWVTEGVAGLGSTTTDKLAKVTTAGVFTQYPFPTLHSEPVGIAKGPDGNLWVTETKRDKVAKVTTSGAFTEYSLGCCVLQARGIVAGPDLNLWLTEFDGNKVGKLTTAGVFTEYPIPTASSGPASITAGPDGNLWFVEVQPTSNNVAKITTSGVITEYPIPTANSSPAGIALGPDGNLWFTEGNANKVAKVTTAGVFTEYTIPTAGSGPGGIVAGPDGNLWFTEGNANKVARVTTSGVFTEYPIPTADSFPSEIASGPDLNIWFIEQGARKVARITVTPAPSPTTFYFAEGYTGSGFTETLSLLMPNQSGTATIDYYLEGGAQKSVMTPLTAGKVTVVDVNATAGANHQVSARVTLPGPGVAERVLHFNTGSWFGSTDQVGVTAPSTEWNFAEGSTLASGPGKPIFSEYLTLQNPNNSVVPVALNYFTDTGLTPVKFLSLAANSRTTVEVFNGDTGFTMSCVPNGMGANCGVGLGIGGVSVQVKSNSLPIIAERPFYVNNFSFGDGPIKDGHDAFGATAPSKLWYFAEGTTIAKFKEYLTIQNATPSPTTVDLKYFTDNAAVHPVKTLVVPASSRVTVEVFSGNTTDNPSCSAGTTQTCGVGPGIGGVSVQVVSRDQPIVAERPMYMYFDFGTGPVAGAHVVVGATGLGKLFGFAAASTLAGENDYLTIQNPGAMPAPVTITYYANSGPVQKSFTVPANSRVTVEVFRGDLTNNPSCSPAAGTCGVGANVSPLGIVISAQQPILVEKPTYNSTSSGYGATDTLGYSPPNF